MSVQFSQITNLATLRHAGIHFSNETTITYQPESFPALVKMEIGADVAGTKTWTGAISCWIHGTAGSYNLHYHVEETSQGSPKLVMTPTVDAVTGLLTVTASEAVVGLALINCGH
jgi:hypothetical protein